MKRLQHVNHLVHRGAVFVIVDAIHRASAFGLDDGRYREAGDGAVGDVLPEEVAGVLRAARRIEVEAKRSYSRHRCRAHSLLSVRTIIERFANDCTDFLLTIPGGDIFQSVEFIHFYVNIFLTVVGCVGHSLIEDCVGQVVYERLHAEVFWSCL